MTSQIPEAASVAEAEAAASLAGVAPVGVDLQPSASDRLVKSAVSNLLPPGAFMTADHRYYFNGEGPVPSVTTVLEVIDKYVLTRWKEREGIRSYIRNRSTVDAILMDQFGGEDKAIDRALEFRRHAAATERSGRGARNGPPLPRTAVRAWRPPCTSASESRGCS